MDLEKFYDRYWSEKNDDIDHNRLEMIVKLVKKDSKVLEISCGLGILAEKISAKANITVTDMSEESLKKVMRRGITKIHKVDTDVEDLPFNSSEFDTIVSNSMMEHTFYPENTIKEVVKVLKQGGEFIVMVPNIGHWFFRFNLLFGRFPYLENTPTDELHLRFFTLCQLKKLGEKYGLKVKMVRGNPGIWVRALYPFYFRFSPVKQVYTLLTNIYPSLFARDLLLVFEK
jgi:methionine biosynthesis protein MetW